ncbi:hypothetical protein ALC62_10279, partial [Cyphomyrmex costatus]
AKYMRKSRSFVKWQRYNVAKNVDDLPEYGEVNKDNKKNSESVFTEFWLNTASRTNKIEVERFKYIVRNYSNPSPCS